MLHFIFHVLQLESWWYGLETALLSRAFLAALSAFLIMLLLVPKGIAWLQSLNAGEAIGGDGPDRHQAKSGTPTMGGLIIMPVLVLATVFWADLNNSYLWLALGVTSVFALLGAYDDYLKLHSKANKGLSIRLKYGLQSVLAIAFILGLLLFFVPPSEQHTLLPFMGETFALGALAYLILGYFTLVGSANAVNLTDGLDGMAAFAVALVAAGLGLLSAYSGTAPTASPFLVADIAKAAELVIFCAALVGTCLGFLWFNAHPAKIFMGDVGSLALGAAIGVVAILIRQELVLFVMGGLFVIEAVSVMLQVAVFKSTGRRLFRMAPIHHHFELLGWPESHVVLRAWVVTAFFVVGGLLAMQVQ